MAEYRAHISQRRTGKTRLAVKYVKTLDNSVLVVANHHMAKYIKQEYDIPERKIYVLQSDRQVYHLKYFKTVIFDEPSLLSDCIQENVLEELLKANCNIIAIGSILGGTSDYILYKISKLQQTHEESRMVSSNRVDVSSCLHEALEELALKVYNEYGVTIQDVDFTWATHLGGGKSLVNVSIRSER